MKPIRVTAAHARRFHRRAVLLDAPAPDVGAALAHHGYVQIDPINVCGRMHDLILRNRVRAYAEGGLMRHLHGEGAAMEAEQRVAFEHFVPSPCVLAAFPLEAWSFLQRSMRARQERDDAWAGRLNPEESAVAKELLREIGRRGPLSSDAFDGALKGDGRKVHVGWGSATLVKSTMQKMFVHGDLLISSRAQGQRRVYDLPERVLPASVLGVAPPSEEEALRWEALLRLRQRRLSTLKKAELKRAYEAVQAVAIEGGPTLYCLPEDAPLFDETSEERSPRADAMLLAPLDPLVYERAVTSALWGYDYIWEVYTPPAKRTRGYYALPLLSGDEIVGHVDPKADREAGKLRVVGRATRRGHPTSGAVGELARFLGLRA